MSLHVSLGAWEVKGSGAVWISDPHHALLMQRAEAIGANLVLRLRNPHVDSAYAAYEVSKLAEQLRRIAQETRSTELAATSSPALQPSALEIDELLADLLELTRRALEWRTDVIVRADGAPPSAR